MNVSDQLLKAFSAGAPSGTTATAKRVTGADPAVNTEISEAVPAGKHWHLLAVTVALVQGATQTPLPTLIITDAADAEVYSSPGASSAQNASVTAQYTWAQGLVLTAGGAATRIYAPLARGLILPAGWKVKTLTAGIGANSNYGAPGLWVVEYA